jgi:pyridoxal phosphate enzyme (YggS family)
VSTYVRRLKEALPAVRERVHEAALRSGRSPEEIRIVAVTKGHPQEAVDAAIDAGLGDLGENRLGELGEKAARVEARAVRWHMIGHLQRRMAPAVRSLASLVHSIDSLRLAERLESTAAPDEPRLLMLAQVNVSGESSKSGFAPGELFEALERIMQFDTLSVEGLMTMAPLTSEREDLRRTFRGLRALREEAIERVPGYRGRELSMGMSNDFELAVEEGSTIVRLGSVLFGEQPA